METKEKDIKEAEEWNIEPEYCAIVRTAIENNENAIIQFGFT